MITKLFCAPHHPGLLELHLVSSFLGKADIGNTLFTSEVPINYEYKSFTLVDQIEKADYILIPHGIKEHNSEIDSYLDCVRELGKKHQKKIIVFIGGDLSHNVFIDDMIVFKGSQYRYLKRKNEIIVPPYAEDLLGTSALILREKSEIPTVGFCGWAAFSSVKQKLLFYYRNFLIDLVSLINPRAVLHKKGIYFRMKALKVLKQSSLIKTLFIVRTTFSANKKTISLDPLVARKEYIDTIINSDFTLAPKGDANFSVRLYEAMSLGRIPLLVDTDTLLPLEWKLNYDSAIFRISFKDIHVLPEKIKIFFDSLTPQTYSEYQKNARKLFIDSLRYDSFFNILFSEPLEKVLEDQDAYYQNLS